LASSGAPLRSAHAGPQFPVATSAWQPHRLENSETMFPCR
jgi:hypothetical protein